MHDAEHLRRFLAARQRGDVNEMRRWWGELVIDFHDRMDGLVAAAHRGRLDDEEHELAVQLALIRFSQRLIDTFKGVSIGELVNACKRLAHGICIDVQRRSMRDRGHRGPSLDDGWDAEREDRPIATWETDEAVGALERQEASADIRAFLDWALPQLVESRRKVVELTFAGAKLEEISAALNITEANAYQLRSRGYRDIIKLKDEYDS